MCEFRLSETSASSESIYKLYECVINKTEIVNKLKFFKQIGEEIQRLRSVRESPEIIALIADWGQGKTTLLSILEEIKHVEKLNFVDILKGDIDFSQNEVVLIDEVETSIELLPEYRDKIRDFWIKIKELANSNKNIVVYLSMTPSAYSKIFGEVLRDLFPETYEAIEQRVKRIHLMPPSKLEFLAVMDCLLEFNKLNKDLLEYMDLPYWTIGQERRKFARFFNDVVCKAGESKNPVDMMFKLLVDNQNLNEEGETIRINEFVKFEKNLDKNEVEEFHKILMSRIFTSKPIEVLKDYVVEGYLVDYYSWAEVVKDGDIIEDFLLVYLNEKDSLDKNLYVFLSDSIDKVIYENVNKGNLEEIIRKLKVRSKKKAYALSWSLFETLVNTNVGGLIVEFESRELKEKAIKFVNEKLLDEEKEVESFISFLKYGMGLEFEEKKINPHTTLLLFKKFNVLVTNKPEKTLPDSLIHGIIILSDESSLDNYYDELSIKVLHLPLSTPIKRQLLYINFYELLNEKGVRLRKEILGLKLGDLIDLVNRFISSVDKELTLPSLPLTKGNKRPIQSFNWIIYAPEIYPAKASEVFIKVDDIVNKKFRIFGAKQFHLEDIETAETFVNDVVHYFAENDVINVNVDIIDFSNLAGKRVKEFTKITVGLLRQILKDKLEGEILKYIQNEEKSDLLNILQKIYGVKRNSVLEFLVYSSIATGEIANYVKIRNLVSLTEIEEKLDKISVSNSYFITAKKREAGIRDINKMVNTIKMYIDLAKKSDDRNFLRFLIVIQTLYKQLNKFLEEISFAEENIVKIKVDINKKLELLKRAKSLVNVKEIEEEKLLLSLPDIVTKIREQIISVINEENPEELMNFIDAIKKISGNDSNNLNLLVWEAVKIIMDGATLPFTQNLKEIFSPIFPLSGINNYFVKLESEISEIEKISPEIVKLQVQLEEKRKETKKLIQQIKNELSE
ncbi:hypothetical protein EWF20_05300 [Sulfolobus sp. S-194]|uniref:hypothetical protein n=1 Tax=Sulfolobus sp. S-194 TaxID=2512240 RepID=UPI001436D692|nr:hypothetical protein [Sulfolobus sp. S-194]QIW23629.1 hypothetical protein EWF20_05300 [Sulfolobus sp. S-194]